MIECRKCGSENHFDGAAFCRQCGADLQARVAIDVAEHPAEQTSPVVNLKPKSEAHQSKNEERDFEVEDVVDPLDRTLSPEPSAASSESGIDKLLSLFGDNKGLDTEPERVEEVSDISGLQLESASDYLLREEPVAEKKAEQPPQPAVAHPAVPPDQHTQQKLSQIEAKLTPIKDIEPEVKNPLGISKKKATPEAVSAVEKSRLVQDLEKSLHSEPEATIHAGSVQPESQKASEFQFESLHSSQKHDTNSVQIEADTILEPAEPEVSHAPSTPVMYVRGSKLLIPEGVRIAPGDQVTLQDRQFSVRKAGIDRRSWILGGVLGLVFITILIVQSMSGSSAPKATVFGVVKNSETNEVLAGVTVSIPQLNLSTVTDEQGVFKFTGVANGRHDVKIEGSLYETRFFPVVIQNNQSDIVYGSLAPVLAESKVAPIHVATTPSAPTEDQPQYGTLKIASNVVDAQVLVDGKSLGKVSQVYKRIKPGNRNIVIQAEGYQEVAQVVNIIAGETTELTANLLSAQSDTPVEYTADDFFGQAESLFDEGKYTEAVGYYTLALAKDNSMVKAYIRRAEAHLKAGKKMNARADYRSAADLYLSSAMYGQAVTCYDKILEFQPDASDAFGLRGWAKIASGDYDNGLRDLQKALSFTPEDPQAQFEVGKAYYITNKYKEAEKALKKIRKHGDTIPEIHGYLALTHLALGDESDARKAFDAFRKVASSVQVARMSAESGWQRLTALAGN